MKITVYGSQALLFLQRYFILFKNSRQAINLDNLTYVGYIESLRFDPRPRNICEQW